MGTQDASDPEHQQLAPLPMRMGGLGPRSATRCAGAAYWASWADALPMIRDRTPQIAQLVVTSLSSAVPPAACCLAELHEAATVLDQQGFWWRPSWTALWQGKRPDASEARDPGEWQHGWQYWASSVSDSSFRKTTMLTNRPASCRAHLRSHSGRNAGIALAHCPTAPEFTIPPHLFRGMLLLILGGATEQRARAQGGYASGPHSPRRCLREYAERQGLASSSTRIFAI